MILLDHLGNTITDDLGNVITGIPLLGGGGATGTFGDILGGGDSVRGLSKKGLFYSLADDTLTLSGTLVGVDGEFSGSLAAATGTFAGTVSAGTITGGTITGTDGAVVVGDGGAIESENYVAGSTGWRIDDTGVEIDDGTFRGDITGGTIDIGVGNFTVDSSGNATANNIDVAGGTISGSILLGGKLLFGSLSSFLESKRMVMQAGTGTILNSLEVAANGLESFVEVSGGPSSKKVKIGGTGGQIYADLPTSLPSNPGFFWNDGGIVKIS